MENGDSRSGPIPGDTKRSTSTTRMTGLTDVGVQIGLAVFAIAMTTMLGITINIVSGLADSAKQASRDSVKQAEDAAESARQAQRQTELTRRFLDDSVARFKKEIERTEVEVNEKQNFLKSQLERTTSNLEEYVNGQIDAGRTALREDIMRSTLMAAASVEKTVSQLVRNSAAVSAELRTGELQSVEIVRDAQSILRVNVKIDGVYSFKAKVAGGSGIEVPRSDDEALGGNDVDLDPIIYLYDTEPIRLLEVNDNGGGKPDAALDVPMKAGTYYLGVGDLRGAAGQCAVSVQMTEFL